MIIGIDASRAFSRDRTGTENYSYQLIKQMIRLPTAQNHQFVLFIRPDAQIPDWISMSNTLVVPIPFRYLWTQVGLARATWRYSLDVLWVPAHTLPVLRKPGLKTVVTIHGLEYTWLPEYKNMLQRWYLPLSTYYATRYATRLIAVSEFTKRQLIEETGVEPEKIEVIHEGVEFVQREKLDSPRARTSEYQKILDHIGVQAKKYILFVGTLQPRKNLEALIEAFALASPSLPGIKLVIAGGHGWMTERIYQAPHRYEVADKVVFTGRVTDTELDSLYSQAVCYVQPSLQEGFGLPLLEAMQHSLPVITSDGGALPEVVGDAGRVVKLGDEFVELLAQTMVEIATHPRLRRQLALRGNERIKQLTWQLASERTLEALTTV